MVDVRENLAKVLKDRACVQAEIARRANMTSSQLSCVLSKTRRLEANELFNLCEVLGISPVELRNYRSNKERTEA